MGTLRDWTCKHLRVGCRRSPRLDEVEALTRQFHVTLRAFITKAEQSATDPVPKALERIREITKKGEENLSWQDAYDIEQQLVHLYDEPTLRVEFQRRLLDAEHSLPSTISAWYKKSAEALQAPSDLAALLSRLINDLQWQYTRNQARRVFTKQVTGRTEIIYALAFLLFVGVLLPPLILLGGQEGVEAENLWLLPFVGFAGAFGAAFSMMTGLKGRLGNSTLDDLKLNRSWGLILARILVGIGAGFVLFFFVRSGLLAGEMFPDLRPLVGVTSAVLVKRGDFAKLFLGCFLAGFSERFVPNLLSKTESNAGARDSERSQYFEQAPALPLPPENEVEPKRRRAASDTHQ